MDASEQPTRAMLAKMLAEFDMDKEMAAVKSASQSRYGIVAVPGKMIPYLTPRQLAKLRQCTVRTLQRHRKAGIGPAFQKIGNKRIRYHIKDIDAWLDEHGGLDALTKGKSNQEVMMKVMKVQETAKGEVE